MHDAAVSSRCRVGIVELVVDADDDVERGVVLDRRRDDDALHAAVEIALELLGLQELAGAFEHDVAAEIAPGTSPGLAAALKPKRVLSTTMARLVVDAERAVPAAVNAVEFQEMRSRGGAALELVEVNDLEPVVGARVACGPRQAAERRPQRQPADAAHAVDADAHSRSPYGAVRAVSPISSSRAFSAILSSEANGRLVKISMRRRIMA